MAKVRVGQWLKSQLRLVSGLVRVQQGTRQYCGHSAGKWLYMSIEFLAHLAYMPMSLYNHDS